ncbi:MAG TPA: hypothetical protein DGG95_08285 [Cytophagales bacterium]|jgi:hypothetical protein|nr:hypothetical protein [Cytophagales bacterium]
MKGKPTFWTDEMLQKLKAEFPFRFNKDIAKDLKLGWRTIVRKARELGLEKDENFFLDQKENILQACKDSLPPNPMKGVKGWSVPNSEATRFKKGQESFMSNPENHRKSNEKRNATIKSERLRLKYNLPQKTKLKLNPYK